MTPLRRNIREDIESRVAGLLDELRELYAGREETEGRIDDAEHRLGVWRDALMLEGRPLGPRRPAADGVDEQGIVAMGLTDAVHHLRIENRMTKPAIVRQLTAVGYDFRGKRPGPAVHFAWLNSLRRKRNGDGAT